MEPARRLAVFDLDGTITRHDTLVPYLIGYARRHPAGLWRLWRLPFTLARYVLGLSDRGTLKSSLIRQVMLGAPRAAVEAWSEEFCRDRLPSLVHPKALQAIGRHRAAGDRLVLLSASVDLYVPAIGKALGFDETICTGISWNGERVEGRLTTPNRRDEEKLRCIEGLRARHPGAPIAAYGNATSDFPHLLAVESPQVVNAGAATRRKAAVLGLPVEDWRA
jgi:HAD superfamily hydrolase (TIGR01490 family)